MRDDLNYKIQTVKKLSPTDIKNAFALFNNYYDAVSLEQFKADLLSKDYIITLFSPKEKTLRGFTTMKVLKRKIGAETVCFLYSGDTIVHHDYWGQQALVKSWCYFAGALKKAGRLWL